MFLRYFLIRFLVRNTFYTKVQLRKLSTPYLARVAAKILNA